MALKTFNPTSAGRRHLIQVDRSHLWKGKPGQGPGRRPDQERRPRQYRPHHLARARAAATRQAYRLIDFRRTKHDVAAIVERLEYDPNRTAFIALIKYADGELSYILAPQRLAVGDTVVAGQSVDVKPGNAMPLGAMPVGTIVHNIETKPGKGGSLARSAGTYAMVAGRDQGYVLLKLKSGETRMVDAACMATRRRGVEPGPPQRSDRQGRTHALEGPSPGLARYRPQPGRPSERRPYQWRQALGNALGQADQGQEDPHQQVRPRSSSCAAATIARSRSKR